MRIIDDPVKHPNAPDDAKIDINSHAPHIKFVDVNEENRFSVVIFVDLATEKEERLLQQEKMLDSNYFENIVYKKVKLRAYLFSVFNFKNIKKNSKTRVFIFFNKIVQGDL